MVGMKGNYIYFIFFFEKNFGLDLSMKNILSLSWYWNVSILSIIFIDVEVLVGYVYVLVDVVWCFFDVNFYVILLL